MIVRELEAVGYDVVRAADGVQALEMHARHQPDLVILDWMLPRLGGLDLGLALVKELTEAMGEAVEVESEVGQGSCFTLRLSRA